eukprot:ctg_5930.g618
MPLAHTEQQERYARRPELAGKVMDHEAERARRIPLGVAVGGGGGEWRVAVRCA